MKIQRVATMSSAPKSILHSREQKSNGNNGGSKEGHASGRVKFSTSLPSKNGGDNDDDGVGRTASLPSRTPTINNRRTTANDGGGGYDSDEVEDAIMASGDAFSMSRRQREKEGDDDTDMNDAAVCTLAEVEEAKRKRGRVRRREEDHDETVLEENADPEAYESNAAGGLGYFDGDTYVFRHNNKPVDGEEDAWLDGFGNDDEEGGGGAGRTGGSEGGGLDSTSIWKPREAKAKDSKRKAKYVNEDAIPEDLGRRLVTLLHNEDDTVMKALTRHGASMRELQAQAHRMIKKTKHKKRKSTKNKEEDSSSTKAPPAASASDTDSEMKQLKRKIEQT
ncbi:hypothetical protein ACHAXR_000908, partial [Thalassiosira sp. AJA248-18]